MRSILRENGDIDDVDSGAECQALLADRFSVVRCQSGQLIELSAIDWRFCDYAMEAFVVMQKANPSATLWRFTADFGFGL